MEAHVIMLCLINAKFLVFQSKHFKMEVFEIILLLFFHSKTHFYMAYISFSKHITMFNLDAITNENNKADN